MDLSTHRLILASASPRRRELLRMLGLDFEILVSNAEESKGELPDSPGEQVMELAARKAGEIAGLHPDALVIAADTIVVAEKQILGKPGDEEDARRMLSFLSGRWHEVYTGVALVKAAEKKRLVDYERTRVKFRPLSREEIDRYIRSGEPMDKAGAYGIQGLGAVLVERIEGCYFNVVGLPLTKLTLMLKEFDVEVLEVSSNAQKGH
ncbi:MAG: septum formation inhibitor Maf [Firmicutes bacterium]|jgi:septum formation protein|nr:septum formation inhibitor Maf [Bacillota bacterium]